VLVVVYTAAGEVLLLQRADDPAFWQSVTGAMSWDERDSRQTAVRELREETGLAADDALQDLARTYRFPILPKWRQRYAPDVQENIEHVFTLMLPHRQPVRLNPAEHTAAEWLPNALAARRVTSWTNRAVIEELARSMAGR